MKRFQQLLFYCLIFFLPTQLGFHFWPSWSFISGLRIDYFSPTIYFTDILVLLILLLSLRGVPTHVRMTKQSVLLVSCFLFLVSLNVYFSLSPFISIYKWLKVGELVLLGYWVSKNFFRLSQNTIFYVLNSAIIFQAFLVCSQYFHHGSLGGLFYFFGERFYTAATPGIAQAVIFGQEFLRPYGTFSHPNVLAGFFATIYPMILIFRKKCNDKKGLLPLKILLVSSTILILIMVIMTISRLGIFVMTGTIFLFSFPYLFPKISKFNPKIFFFGFLFLLLISIAFRWELNQLALTNFLKKPLFGVGLGVFPLTLVKGIFFQPAHNIYLLVLSETGLIGFSLFVFLIFKTLENSFQISNFKFAISLVIILFLGMFDHYFLTLQQTQLLFAIILGLAWSKIDK